MRGDPRVCSLGDVVSLCRVEYSSQLGTRKFRGTESPQFALQLAPTVGDGNLENIKSIF